MIISSLFGGDKTLEEQLHWRIADAAKGQGRTATYHGIDCQILLDALYKSPRAAWAMEAQKEGQ
jgi:hypothetical protein